MAKCQMQFPDSFEISLKELGANVNQVCENALEKAADVALPIVKDNLSSAIAKTKDSRSTGELVKSVGASPVKTDRNGIYNIKVGFNEPRRVQYAAKGKRTYYQITNAMIANVIEHGKHGQPARPFMAKSKRQAKKSCIEAMKKSIEEDWSKYT